MSDTDELPPAASPRGTPRAAEEAPAASFDGGAYQNLSTPRTAKTKKKIERVAQASARGAKQQTPKEMLREARRTPGPGAFDTDPYSISKQANKNSKSAMGKSVGKELPWENKKYLGDKATANAPDFYDHKDPKLAYTTKKQGFSTATGQRFVDKAPTSLGPGEYNTMNKAANRGFAQSSSANFGKTSSQRFKTKANTTPGPGSFANADPHSISSKAARNKKSSMGKSVGKEMPWDSKSYLSEKATANAQDFYDAKTPRSAFSTKTGGAAFRSTSDRFD